MDTLLSAILQSQPILKHLKSGSDVACVRDQAGLTPLHHAVLAGNIDAVNALLSHASRSIRPLRRASGSPSRAAGSPWDLVTAPGPPPSRPSPLHLAAERSEAILRHMLAHSSLVSVGASFLGIIISSRPQPELLELRDARGWSLLHYAASRSNIGAVRYLLLHMGCGDGGGGGSGYSSSSSSAGGAIGGGTGPHDDNGNTATWPAGGSGGVNATDVDGYTVLHTAALLGHADCCRLLLKAGADQSRATSLPEAAMPIHLAAAGNHTAAVEALFRHAAAQQGFRAAQAMLLRPNGAGETALHVAARQGAVDAARRLLHLVFPFDTRGPLGRTAFHMAALRGNVPMLQMLTRHSTPLQRELVDIEGFTAAHLAAAAGRLDALRVLATGGCNMDARAAPAPAAPAGCEGWTPLHCAARSGDVAAIELLVCELGADPHARDASGRTPCDLAVAVASSRLEEGSLDGGSGVQNLDDGSLDAVAADDDGGGSGRRDGGCGCGEAGGASSPAAPAGPSPAPVAAPAPVQAVGVATAGGVAMGFLRGPSICEWHDGSVSGGGGRLHELQALAVLQTFIRLLHKPARRDGGGPAQRSEPVSPAPSAVVSPTASEAPALQCGSSSAAPSGGVQRVSSGMLVSGGSSGPRHASRAAERAAERAAAKARRAASISEDAIVADGADAALAGSPMAAQRHGAGGLTARRSDEDKATAMAVVGKGVGNGAGPAVNGHATSNHEHHGPYANGLTNGVAFGVDAAAARPIATVPQAVPRPAGTASRPSPFMAAAQRAVHPTAKPSEPSGPSERDTSASVVTPSAATDGKPGTVSPGPRDPTQPASRPPVAPPSASPTVADGLPMSLEYAAQLLAAPAATATATRASPFGPTRPAAPVQHPAGTAGAEAANARVGAVAAAPVVATSRPSPFVTKPSPFGATAAKPSPFGTATRPSPFVRQVSAQPPAEQPAAPSPAAAPPDEAPTSTAAAAEPPAAALMEPVLAPAAEAATAVEPPGPAPELAVPRTSPVDIPTTRAAGARGAQDSATPFATAVAIAAGAAPASPLATVPSPGGSTGGGTLPPSSVLASDGASSGYMLSAINSPFGFSALNRAILLQRHALVDALLATLPATGAGSFGNALAMPAAGPPAGLGRPGVARKPSLPTHQPSLSMGAAKSSSLSKVGQLSPAASAPGAPAGEPGARAAAVNRQGQPPAGLPSRLKRPPSHPRDLSQLPQQAQPQPQPEQAQLQHRNAPVVLPQPQFLAAPQPQPAQPQHQPHGDTAVNVVAVAGGAPLALRPPPAPSDTGPPPDLSTKLPPLLPLGNLNGFLASAGSAILDHPSAPVPGVLSWDEPTATFCTHHPNHVSRVWLHWPGTPDPATGWLLAEMVVVEGGATGGHVWLGLGPAPDALPQDISNSASSNSLAAAAATAAAAAGASGGAALTAPAGGAPLARAPTAQTPAALLGNVGPMAPAGTAAAVAAARCPVMNHPHTHVICVRDGQAFRGGVLTLDLGGAVRMEARVGDVVALFWNRVGRAVAFTLNGKYCGRLAGLPTEEHLTPVVGLQCGSFSFRWRCVSNGVFAGSGAPGSGGCGRVAGNIDGLMIREQMLNEDPETPWLCKEPSMTSLHFAAWAGNMRVLPQLVRAKSFAPDEPDADGWTPLHFAALAGQFEVVRALIGLGCHPDAKSKCGQTPALLSAKYGRSPDHVAIVRLLADLGAALDVRDPRGRTLLMLAARAGNLAMVQLLLERGLDASATDNQDREAVQFAGQHGAIFRLLRTAQEAQRVGARKARPPKRQQDPQLDGLPAGSGAAAAAAAAVADPPLLPIAAAVAEPGPGPGVGGAAAASSVGSELAGDGDVEGSSEGDARGRDVDARHLPLLAERWRVGAGQLVRGRLIEQGAFGAVFEGTWCSARVAIKQVLRRRHGGSAGGAADGDVEREAAREVVSLQREVAILAALPPHERIARMLGSVELPGEGVCLVMAYYPHTLQGVMQSERLRRSWLTPIRRASIARQLAEGLAFLHGLPGPRIIHRDLKPNNVLLEAPPSLGVKICDFGLARLLMNNDVQSSSAAGHAFWMAPELLRALSYDEKVDVYSYGVILYQLAYWVDDQLYGGLNKAQVDFQVVHGILRLQDRLPGGIDPGVHQLVHDCLDENPRARPSMAQVLERLATVRELPQPQQQQALHPPAPAGAAVMAAAVAGGAAGASVLAPDAAHAVGRQGHSPPHQHANGLAAAVGGRSPDGREGSHHHAPHAGHAVG